MHSLLCVLSDPEHLQSEAPRRRQTPLASPSLSMLARNGTSSGMMPGVPRGWQVGALPTPPGEHQGVDQSGYTSFTAGCTHFTARLSFIVYMHPVAHATF